MIRRSGILLFFFGIVTLWLIPVRAAESGVIAPEAFLPFISRVEPPPEPVVEFRGLWVSRFDWTSSTGPADPAKIDEIVNNAAAAGFNAIFFQVRGTADAFYTPGLEPWSSRVSGGQLGQPPDPYWDPLQRMIEKAHARGIQVHAYLNVYPIWTGCQPPYQWSTPQHLFYKLSASTQPPLPPNQYNHIVQTSSGVLCGSYMFVTPASFTFDDHFLALTKDLVNRYDIDGLHLDYIRYGSSAASCDPVSEYYAGGDCFATTPNGYTSWADWQRAQINGLVYKIYDQVVPLKPQLLLSAAVWPVHTDKWGWGAKEGFHEYYQDSKAWIRNGWIDAISPMIYPSVFQGCDGGGNYEEGGDFWTRSRWNTLAADFQAGANGRFLIPGIGTGYCSFAEIESRIQMARDLGTAGHALFSYRSLLQYDYFDDLARGPYAEPAVPPTITWHP